MSLTVRRIALLTVAVLLALGIAATLMLVPGVARAETGGGAGPQTWAVVPANAEGPDGRAAFDYVVEPDDVYSDFVAVRNLGEEPLTLALYAQDAVQTVDDAFDVLTPEEGGRLLGEWLRLEAQEVTVPARGQVVVPFEIDVPADAEPGDHAGGIVAVSAVAEGTGTTVQYRVGARIHLRVAGPVEAGLAVDGLSGRYDPRWAPFASGPLHVDATLLNTGNVRVTPAAQVRISGLFGWWSTTAPLEGLDEILPAGARAASADLPAVPPLGPLWVTVEATEISSAGQDVTAFTAVTSPTVVVWAVPWVLLIAVVLLLVAAAIAVVNLRRRRRVRPADAGPMAETPEGGA